ncbi:MAG: prolipoprotein diacylglyceryl transferase [Elusimicrobiota bacterium]|nr:prolipoprotein diacylglyceryl transferase [Elusimicrobiota bacterium]
MYPVLFRLGPLTIYSYGLMVAIGCLAGFFYIRGEAKRIGFDMEKIMSLFLWVLISGFVGGRILYIFVEWERFLNEPLRTIFGRGGFVFYGGFVLAFGIGVWQIRRKSLNLWKTADIFTPAVAVAYAIGRIGCFLNGCCYGRPTDSWLGVSFPSESPAGSLGEPLIPIQLFSSLNLFVIFGVLLTLRRYKKFDGQLFWLYVLLYGVSRSIIEIFRGDPRGQIWMFSTSQFLGIIFAILALIMLGKLGKEKRQRL